MIGRMTVDGKSAVVAYLALDPEGGFRDVEPQDAEIVKVMFDDGGLLMLRPERGEKFYSEDQPRDWHGRWTDEGGEDVGGVEAGTYREPPAEIIKFEKDSWDKWTEPPPEIRALGLPISKKDPDREEAVWVSPDGVRHFRAGDGNSIAFDPQDRESMKGSVFTHLHPSGQSFSPEDIVTASYQQLKELRAFGRADDGNRYIYSMKAGKQGWLKMNAGGIGFGDPTGISNDHPFVKDVNMFSLLTREKFTTEIREGLRTVQQAEAEHWHEVWKQVAPRYGLIYKRTKVKA